MASRGQEGWLFLTCYFWTLFINNIHQMHLIPGQRDHLCWDIQDKYIMTFHNVLTSSISCLKLLMLTFEETPHCSVTKVYTAKKKGRTPYVPQLKLHHINCKTPWGKKILVKILIAQIKVLRLLNKEEAG